MATEETNAIVRMTEYLCESTDCCSGLPAWVWFTHCARFGWDRVNFLYSSWYGAGGWICTGNSTDDTGLFLFLLLLSRPYTRSRPFLLLTPHQRVRLGMHKEFGGDTNRTADPNRPKGYHRPYGILLSIQRWGKGGGKRKEGVGHSE